MSYIVSLDKDGHIVYNGFLTTKEIATADEILKTLKKEIPIIEADLKEKYNKSVYYRYYLGEFLGKLLTKFNIPMYERNKFWQEINTFATKENQKGKNFKNQKQNYYEQCYILSTLDLEVVEKLSGRMWKDLLNSSVLCEEKRFFEWIRQRKERIHDEDWREFKRGLYRFVKDKDLSVFTDAELFELYESVLNMCIAWRIAFKLFSVNHPESAKIKTKLTRAKRYQEKCFELKRKRKVPLNDDIFVEAFTYAMK